MQRPDDNEATVTERLRVYDEKTRPLIDFYRARSLLRVINAAGDVDQVTRRLAQALGAPALLARRAAGARRKPRGSKPRRPAAKRSRPAVAARSAKRGAARARAAVPATAKRRGTGGGRRKSAARPRKHR
jgi:hypothetical protein